MKIMCSSVTTIFLLASSVWNLDVRNISRIYVSVLIGFSDVVGPINHVFEFHGVLQQFFFFGSIFAFVMISYISTSQDFVSTALCKRLSKSLMF